MAGPSYMDQLPTPPTQEDIRAAVLRRDPRALALMMAGDPGIRETGRAIDSGQLARQQEARTMLGEQFRQAMAGPEMRQKERGLDIEASRNALAWEQLELGRWVPIQGADGITYLYDQKTHTVVNGVVPGQGWLAGGQPGQVVSPGTRSPAPLRGTPAVPQPRPAPGPAAAAPPATIPSHSPAPGAPGPQPQAQAQPQLPDQARRFMELAARKAMPPEALKELDQLDKTRQTILLALKAVRDRPHAFDSSQSWEEYPPTDFLRQTGRNIHARYRDPQDTATRALVYTHTVGQMHDYFGARMTEPEFARSGLFLPGITDPADNIEAKLRMSLQALDAYEGRLAKVYMPALSMMGGRAPLPTPGLAAGAPPAPGATGAPGAGALTSKSGRPIRPDGRGGYVYADEE